jgi:hypothetical protein
MFPFVLQRKEKKFEKKENPKQNLYFWAILFAVIALAIYASNQWQKNNENDKLVLEKARLKKFEKDSARLENCVQYVLYASKDGFYPCHSCSDSVQIFLHKGEVWYYGETCYETSRYDEDFRRNSGLNFFVQYRGNKHQVILEQKRKIYHYPLLPEAVNRKFSIIRPPGNKNDN